MKAWNSFVRDVQSPTQTWPLLRNSSSSTSVSTPLQWTAFQFSLACSWLVVTNLRTLTRSPVGSWWKTCIRETRAKSWILVVSSLSRLIPTCQFTSGKEEMSQILIWVNTWTRPEDISNCSRKMRRPTKKSLLLNRVVKTNNFGRFSSRSRSLLTISCTEMSTNGASFSSM